MIWAARPDRSVPLRRFRCQARWKAFILLKTFASLRWGEITALTRADVDPEQCRVRVRGQFLTVTGERERIDPMVEIRIVECSPGEVVMQIQQNAAQRR